MGYTVLTSSDMSLTPSPSNTVALRVHPITGAQSMIQTVAAPIALLVTNPVAPPIELTQPILTSAVTLSLPTANQECQEPGSE
ncbi:hypothetical protein DAPPUDRAFT_324632 [Daphnia pulex]|uniref:Uncharacterized protein n=1 Tax=Daphnia pulex TaxID=6669 RepID=E9H2A5_DAPPU|nr:hypothetical protein DAPPUDRAFT_324632 [Daphnia pulex]|eukprot:EFX74178.1 hypothetical protein DAPPUDRAFT_324632 [Daphnia pulex]